VVKEVNQFFADFVDTGAAVQQGRNLGAASGSEAEIDS